VEKKYTVSEIGPRIERFLRPMVKGAGFALDFKVAEGPHTHPDLEDPEIAVSKEVFLQRLQLEAAPARHVTDR